MLIIIIIYFANNIKKYIYEYTTKIIFLEYYNTFNKVDNKI